jgi:hypothetical protein
MNKTQLAILGRFGGDRRKAMDYCERTARENPRLWGEYMVHRQTIEYETTDAKAFHGSVA